MGAVAPTPDGELVVVGTAARDTEPTSEFVVARYGADGQLDLGFGGGDGVVFTRLGTDTRDQARDVVVQPDGRIVVAGASGSDIAVARYLSDGSPDTSFGGGDGVVTTSIFEGSSANAVSLQGDGSIVVGGWASDFGSAYEGVFALTRYTPSGAPDTSFDGDGIVTTGHGASAIITSLDIDSSGAILATGNYLSCDCGGYGFAVARYLADGSPDSSFHHGHLIEQASATKCFGGGDIAAAPGQKVVVSGDDCRFGREDLPLPGRRQPRSLVRQRWHGPGHGTQLRRARPRGPT